MSPKVSKVVQDALKLPAAARAALAGSLIESLDARIDEAAEGAWRKEIAKRAAELDSGAVASVSWREVRRRLRAR
jgi:putative addiction module component (TIGR02574 family)